MTPDPAAVRDAVRAHDGVAAVSVLVALGHSRWAIRRAVERGMLVRVRPGWLAIPGADPALVAAARHGVVLSCITQARRRGLWVLAGAETHVAAPSHSGRANAARATVHWSRPVVPRHPHALVDPIENVLALVAVCQPFEAALAVWESALRQEQVDKGHLARLALPAAARAVLEAAEVFSDSGLETFVVPRLRWLRVPLRRQIWIAGHRVDLLIGDRLVMQIDGGHHVGTQRDQDIAHDGALLLLGYHVIRVSYRQVVDGWHEVQDLIMRAVAQGLHRSA